MLRKLAFLILSSIPISAFSQDGVLVEHVPKGAAPEVVIRVIKQAFSGRQWVIESVTDSDVSAKIRRGTVRARIRIQFSNGSLIYSGDAQRLLEGAHPANTGASGGLHWTPIDVPENWVRNLQVDIGRMFATIPDR